MTRHLNLQNDRIAVNKEALESQVHNLEATFNKELVDQFSRLQNRFMFGVIAAATLAIGGTVAKLIGDWMEMTRGGMKVNRMDGHIGIEVMQVPQVRPA